MADLGTRLGTGPTHEGLNCFRGGTLEPSPPVGGLKVPEASGGHFVPEKEKKKYNLKKRLTTNIGAWRHKSNQRLNKRKNSDSVPQRNFQIAKLNYKHDGIRQHTPLFLVYCAFFLRLYSSPALFYGV